MAIALATEVTMTIAMMAMVEAMMMITPMAVRPETADEHVLGDLWGIAGVIFGANK